MEADEAAAEVAAMQFAGGKSIAEVAAEWEMEPERVEAAVRRALLATIPKYAGGLKPTRFEVRKRRGAKAKAAREAQRELGW